MKKEEKEILKHTLGLDYEDVPFRNHYYAGKNHHAIDTLKNLVKKGFMRKRKEPFGASGIVFHVTKKGMKALVLTLILSIFLTGCIKVRDDQCTHTCLNKCQADTAECLERCDGECK